MPAQTPGTRVKASVILDPDNIPVESHSTNESATFNLSVRYRPDKVIDHWNVLLLIV